MVTLRIVNLDLGPSVDHISTDWDVATDPLFEDIILTSREDKDNLRFIVFDETLDPTKKYYSRARTLLSTGYTAWGNIDTFTPYDINDIEIDIERPSLVTAPIITTDFDPNHHPLGLFNINFTGFATTTSATHESTTIIIEDINNKVVFNSIDDKYNKTQLKVFNFVLLPNTIYRVKAYFKSTSGDYSNISTKTIVTNPVSVVPLTRSLFAVNLPDTTTVNVTLISPIANAGSDKNIRFIKFNARCW